MNTAHTTTKTTAEAFANGHIDKWTAYGTAWDLMDRRQITLTEICDIFEAAGIRSEVVRMRRRDYLGMRAR